MPGPKSLQQQLAETVESIAKSHNEVGSLQYAMYIYREELWNSNNEYLDLTKMKLQLTDTLIMYGVRNLSSMPIEEILNLHRIILFKKTLRKRQNKIRKLEKLGFQVYRPRGISCL